MGKHTRSGGPTVRPAPRRPAGDRSAARRRPAPWLLRAAVTAGLAVALVVAPQIRSEPAASVDTAAVSGAMATQCTNWSSCRAAIRTAVQALLIATARTGRPVPAAAAPTPAAPAATAPVAARPSGPSPAGTTAPTSSPAARLVQYAPTDEVLANPERGFYHYTETHWSPDGSAYTPLDAGRLAGWRTTEAVTLVYRVFYLDGLVERDAVDPRFLAQVAADLQAARAAGVKLVVRFAYSADSGRDAPPARAVAHISQLAPVLNAGSDVVFVLQAGFIGRWGEWYYSDSFASDPAQPWALTDADWAARDRVLDALLDSTSPDIWVQVRYPAIKQRLLGAGDPRAARVGVHNDCFLASDTDMGTFASAADRTWLASQSRTLPVGGETCAANAPRSHWDGAVTDLRRYHWTFLNADFSRDVLDSWGTAGRTEAARSLGYRLALTSASLPATARPGARVTMELTLTNGGYAAPVSDRPAQLVFRSGAQTVSVPVPLDVRTLTPGASHTVRFEVPVPTTRGGWALSLALPDPAPSLSGDPAYAIRLANQGLWDPATGRNDLRHVLTVA